MEILEILQQEMVIWQQHNFPDRPSWIPLMGIVEELGELEVASNKEQAIDAVSDVMIFLADYLNTTMFKLVDLFDCSGIDMGDASDCLKNAHAAVGNLAHAHIKQHQKIRTNENQTEQARQALSNLIASLRGYALEQNFNFEFELGATWNKVKQRDWIKFPKNGKTE